MGADVWRQCIMSEFRKYYEAYDDRYRQVHGENLRWFAESPSPIVSEIMSEFKIGHSAKILEIGCGEGRDAAFLLEQGFDVLATDISPEAISYCTRKHPDHREHFRTLNCITDRMDQKFDFLYAVAVVHMLVQDEDRDGFYRFIWDQLAGDGIALICTMGDGEFERASDITAAFELQERTHEESGKTVCIAGTSYRAVSFETFADELERNELRIVKQGLTNVEPDYGTMMYAVARRK